jgi:putative PIN family toxin of toxin-antitoxin system
MRVVLDTSVLIAALITTGTPPDRIYQGWRKRRFELITSEWQLAEFRPVSRYERLRPYLVPAEAGAMVNGLRREAIVLQSLPAISRSSDPQDDPILATAVGGEADYLVTGDKRGLLALKTIGRARIITARAFVDDVLGPARE